MVATFDWVLHDGTSPIKGHQIPASVSAARAEQEAAALTALTPSSVAAAEVGYGVWTVLSWLLGDRSEAPVQLGEGHHRRRPWVALPARARAEILVAGT